MRPDAKHSFDVMGFLTQRATGWTSSNYRVNQAVYSQGEPADSVFLHPQG